MKSTGNRLQAVNVTGIKLVQFKYKLNTLINKPPSVVVIRIEIN